MYDMCHGWLLQSNEYMVYDICLPINEYTPPGLVPDRECL